MLNRKQPYFWIDKFINRRYSILITLTATFAFYVVVVFIFYVFAAQK